MDSARESGHAPSPQGRACDALGMLLPGLATAAVSCLLLLQDPGYFWQDDFQTYQLAGFCEVARSWENGEFPLLSPCSWQGGALAAEYQYGVFSVFLTLCVIAVSWLGLSFPLSAAALSVLHLAVLSAGAYRLGRSRGLAIESAVLLGLVSALSGWIFLWGARFWFPALASFAWLPWFWWSLHYTERPERGRLSFLPAAIFLYLIVSAGWPFTVLMAGLLSVWFLLRTSAGCRAPRSLWRMAAAWAIGLSLSAPAWLMLIEYAQSSVRGQQPFLVLNDEWTVPIAGLPGLVFPFLISDWAVFERIKAHVCIELNGGLVPLAGIVAALLRLGRSFVFRLRWEFGLCIAALALSALPSLGTFRWSFRWLPLFFLVLGLIGAFAIEELRARRAGRTSGAVEPASKRYWHTVDRGPNLGVCALALIVPVWLWALHLGVDPTSSTFRVGLLLTSLCLCWAHVEASCSPASVLCRWLPCGIVVVSSAAVYLGASPFCEVPCWRIPASRDEPWPIRPTRLYLSLHTDSDAFRPDASRAVRFNGGGEQLCLGSTSMYSGLQLVNGYSPIMPKGLTEVFEFGYRGFLARRAAERLLTRESGRDGLLQRMGIDGLIVADQFAAWYPELERNGWHLVQAVSGGWVFHRMEPASPRVRALQQAVIVADRQTALECIVSESEERVPSLLLDVHADSPPLRPQSFASAQLTVVRESRNSIEVVVKNPALDRSALVVFSRPWYPGYQASIGGHLLPVHLLDLIMPAVEVPPGTQGRLVLKYRPRSLVFGMWAAGFAGFVILGLACSSLRDHRNRWRGLPLGRIARRAVAAQLAQ